MKTKEKSWIWFFTLFAWRNYTCIWETIYYPKGHPPFGTIIAHETIHSMQQKKWGRLGLPIWLWLYVVGFPLGLPFLYNPWRYKWEFEAYTLGSMWTAEQAKRMLHSSNYGWLIFNS